MKGKKGRAGAAKKKKPTPTPEARSPQRSPRNRISDEEQGSTG